MKSLKKTITIHYNWHRNDGKDINEEHFGALEETAEEEIRNRMMDGYISGELNDNIKMLDDDPEDGVSYSGWWEGNNESEEE